MNTTSPIICIAVLIAAAMFCCPVSDAGAKKVKVIPQETDELLANPGMGWQTFHRFADEDKNLEGLPSTSAYFRFYWSEVEPVEGQIDFARFDSLLAHAHRAGQKLAFRIMCAGTTEDYMYVPRWLKEKGCPGFEYQYEKQGPKHWVPDMDSPVFQEAHFRLIRELGKRYDGHPDLDLVDIGSVGLWGEWHMSGTGAEMPGVKTRLAIIDAYCKAFPKTPKVMLIGDDEGMKHAVQKGCGWRADCIGDMGGFSKTWNHMRDFYPQAVEKAKAETAWQKAPVAFESCWDMRKWKQEGWDIRYIFEYGLNFHASFLNNKSAPIPEGTRPEIERFLRKIGYRLVLRQLEYNEPVAPGASLAISMAWENVGVAPPYRDYQLAFRLVNVADKTAKVMVSKTSIKGWLPGETRITESLKLPQALRPGRYELALAVVDPATKEPAVRLAIAGRAEDGWYPLSQVEVSGKGAKKITPAKEAPARGPLKVHPSNPRYFTGGSGKAIYLTGAHTWSNFKDMGPTDPPPVFDFNAYLDFLHQCNHNFIRLWTWELTVYSYNGNLTYATPFPWLRTGPGMALDGKPKFDLKRFNQKYFDRLRSRVAAAGKRGIYVSIMLFEGHGLHASLKPWCWDGHPFNRQNNINGIDGDPDGDGRGLETQTLQIPAVTALQEACVRKVIDTVNDLDNVLYEICNEAGPYSTEWQYHMIRFIKEYQSEKPQQHPVGMTFQYPGGSNKALFDSPADWISPNPEGGYTDNPPAADGSKVILSDTDHLWGIGGNTAWVWKSFCRGMNPLFMDPYRAVRQSQGRETTWTDHLSDAPALDPQWEPIRKNLGYTLSYARRMNLAAMTPRNDLASTRYCLANPGAEYLIYLPGGGSVTVNLGDVKGRVSLEWLNPDTGVATDGGTARGGGQIGLTAPFDGDAVLYIRGAK